jgi:hypothetical protein
MELNLHIIIEDLAGYALQSRIEEDYDVRRLRSAALFDGNATRRGLLYVVEASLLTSEDIRKVTEQSSLLLIGRPPRALLKKSCNLAWTENLVPFSRLFSDVVTIFTDYELWNNRMMRALITKKHLRYLGELASPLIRRPLYLIDSHLQMVFSVVDEESYEVPSDYQMPVIDNNDPGLGIYALDRFYDDALAFHEPFLLSTEQRYGTLVQNIFIDEHLVATLSFDEVGGAFTKRDYALIVVLGDFIRSGITYRDEWNTSVPQLLDEQIHILLSGSRVDLEDLDVALKSLAWLTEETYYCLIAVPLNPLYPSGLLAATAKLACARASHMIYTIHDERMVFIVNADHATISQQETAELLVEELGRLQVRIGVSNIYGQFWSLSSHYRLAVVAAEIGSETKPDEPYYRFEDYFMEYLFFCCKESTPLEAVIPRGLLQLKRYDEKYRTDFVNVLHVFLRHDMRTATAARELFLHRNTLSHKISQIKFITRLDFENDPDVRLRLLVALKMLDFQGGEG